MKRIYTTITRVISCASMTLLLMSAQMSMAQSPTWSWANSEGGTGSDIGLAIASDNTGDSYSLVQGEINVNAQPLTGVSLVKHDAIGTEVWGQELTGATFGIGSVHKDDLGVYVTGQFDGATLDIDTSSLTNAGTRNSFVAKFDQLGNFIWVKHIKSNVQTETYDVTTDASGNVYITGRYSGNGDWDGTLNTAVSGDDMFIAKYDADGNLVWVEFAGGNATQVGIGAEVNDDRLYLTGSFSGDITMDAFVLNSAGGLDFFVAQYDLNGNAQWVTHGSGTGSANMAGISVDNDGNSFAIGSMNGTITVDGLTMNGPFIPVEFITKIDVNGNAQWNQLSGSTTFSEAKGVTTDVAGNSYICGSFTTSIIIDTMTLTNATPTSQTAYLAKFDPDGNVLWGRMIDGNTSSRISGVGVDNLGGVYIAGEYRNTATLDAINHTSQGQNDVLVGKLDDEAPELPEQAPEWVWASKIESTGLLEISAIANDTNDNTYVTGQYSGTITTGSVNLISASGENVYTIKFDNSGTPVWGVTSSGSSSFPASRDVAVDEDGNVIIIGDYEGSITFDSETNVANGKDVFVVKYSSSGVQQWAKFGTGNATDFGQNINTDGKDIIVSGSFQSDIALGGFSFNDQIPASSADMWLIRLDENGNAIGGRHDWGSGVSSINSAAVDSGGNIYAAVRFSGIMIVGPDNITADNPGGDELLVKYSNNQNPLWFRHLGGTAFKGIMNTAVDDITGQSYVVGAYQNDLTILPDTTLVNAGFAGFLLSFDKDGQLLWSYTLPTAGIKTVRASDNGVLLQDASGITKYDKQGEILWNKVPGGVDIATGEGINAFATGDLSGLLSFDAITLNGNGVYVAKMGEQSACTPPVTSAITGPGSVCSNDTIQSFTVSGTAGSSFDWSVPSGATIIFGTSGPDNDSIVVNFGTSSGNVSVVETTSDLCTGDTVFLAITVNPLPTVNAGSDQTVCAGDNVTLSGAGADSYVWDNGVTDGVPFVASATTTYSVIGTDLNGCSNSDQVTVTVNPLPTVNAGSDQTVCAGDNVTLSGAGADSYVWDNGVTNGVPFVASATTTYTVIGTDLNGCSNSDQVTVTVNPLPTVNAGSDQTVCAGDNVTLSGAGADSYVWDNGVTDGVPFVATATTTYTVIGTDLNGCSNSDQVTVTVNPLPTVNAGSDQTVCAGDNVTLSGAGADSYVWDNGVTDGVPFVATATTTYTVIGTDLNGCSNSDQVTVTVNPLPTVNAGSDQTVCAGDNVTLSGAGADSYVWDNGVTDGVPFVATATTTYTVIGTDLNGCSNSDQVTVTVNPLPTVNAGSDQTVCAGDNVTLSGAGADSYVWDNGVTDGVPFVATATTSYTVIGTDLNGCSNSDQVTVTVNPLPTVSSGVATQSFETIDPVFNFPDGVPSGGVYTIDGLPGNSIDPSAGVGVFEVVYTYTDIQGCINSDTTFVTVNVPSCIYAVGNVDVVCGQTSLCVPLNANLPVPGGMLGIDYTLNYDPLVLSPKTSATLGPVVPSPYGEISVNISVPGKVFVTIYLDAPPSGTFLSGAGEIACVNFDLITELAPGTDIPLTLDGNVIEGIPGGGGCPAIPGNLNFDNEELLEGTLRYRNKNGQKISYDVTNPDSLLITDIFGVDAACDNPTAIPLNPGLQGEFTHDVNNGPSLVIKRDVPGDTSVPNLDCSDVMSVINSSDRNRALKISNFQITNPSVYDLISADVNRDGVVNSFDVTAISMRSINGNNCEFIQGNYVFDGSNYVPGPNYEPSVDWVFIDEATIDDPSFTAGMDRNNVPQIPDCIPIDTIGLGHCTSTPAMIYEGILLGDVNGNWKTNNHGGSSKLDELIVVIDLLNADSLGFGSYLVPVSCISHNAVTGLDLNIDYNGSNLDVVNVSANPDVSINHMWNDIDQEKLMITSFNADGIAVNSELLYLDVTTGNGELTLTDIGSVNGYINGEPAKIKIKTKPENPDEYKLHIYPNPGSGLYSLYMEVGYKQTVQVELKDMMGHSIKSTEHLATSQYMQQLDISDLANGVYLLQVTIGDQTLTKKLIKQ